MNKVLSLGLLFLLVAFHANIASARDMAKIPAGTGPANPNITPDYIRVQFTNKGCPKSVQDRGHLPRGVHGSESAVCNWAGTPVPGAACRAYSTASTSVTFRSAQGMNEFDISAASNVLPGSCIKGTATNGNGNGKRFRTVTCALAPGLAKGSYKYTVEASDSSGKACPLDPQWIIF